MYSSFRMSFHTPSEDHEFRMDSTDSDVTRQTQLDENKTDAFLNCSAAVRGLKTPTKCINRPLFGLRTPTKTPGSVAASSLDNFMFTATNYSFHENALSVLFVYQVLQVVRHHSSQVETVSFPAGAPPNLI